MKMGKEEEMKKALDLYDVGKWKESIEIYEKIRLKNGQTRDIDAMEGWVYWKKKEILKATILWSRALDLMKSPDIVNSTAFSGLGLAMAEEKNPIALKYVEMGIAMLPEGEETIDVSIRLNTCTIAIAKLGYPVKAEEIIRRAIEINERFEKSKDAEIAKRAKHQRAKNGYNLSALILIPQGRLEEAYDELEAEVIPRYKEVGAISDEAAAWYRVGFVNEEKELYYNAEVYYRKSKELWEIIGDTSRIKGAQTNIDRVEKLIHETQ